MLITQYKCQSLPSCVRLVWCLPSSFWSIEQQLRCTWDTHPQFVRFTRTGSKEVDGRRQEAWVGKRHIQAPNERRQDHAWQHGTLQRRQGRRGHAQIPHETGAGTRAQSREIADWAKSFQNWLELETDTDRAQNAQNFCSTREGRAKLWAEYQVAVKTGQFYQEVVELRSIDGESDAWWA